MNHQRGTQRTRKNQHKDADVNLTRTLQFRAHVTSPEQCGHTPNSFDLDIIALLREIGTDRQLRIAVALHAGLVKSTCIANLIRLKIITPSHPLPNRKLHIGCVEVTSSFSRRHVLRYVYRNHEYRAVRHLHMLGSIRALITRPEATRSSASLTSDRPKLWSGKRFQGSDRTASLMIWTPR